MAARIKKLNRLPDDLKPFLGCEWNTPAGMLNRLNVAMSGPLFDEFCTRLMDAANRGVIEFQQRQFVAGWRLPCFRIPFEQLVRPGAVPRV